MICGFYSAMLCIAQTMLSQDFRLSVRLSHASIVSTRLHSTLLWNANRKPYQAFKWYHFQWPWTTPNPVFMFTPLFHAENLSNNTRCRHSYNAVLIGTYTCFTQWCHSNLEWAWVTWQNIQGHKASHGLSATDELLVLTYVYYNTMQLSDEISVSWLTSHDNDSFDDDKQRPQDDSGISAPPIPDIFLLSKHTWSHICSTYPYLQFDCIAYYFLYRDLEAACAAYASLNLSLLHYITVHRSHVVMMSLSYLWLRLSRHVQHVTVA